MTEEHDAPDERQRSGNRDSTLPAQQLILSLAAGAVPVLLAPKVTALSLATGVVAAGLVAFLTAPGRRRERRAVVILVIILLFRGARSALAAVRRRGARETRSLPSGTSPAASVLPASWAGVVLATIVGAVVGVGSAAGANGLLHRSPPPVHADQAPAAQTEPAPNHAAPAPHVAPASTTRTTTTSSTSGGDGTLQVSVLQAPGVPAGDASVAIYDDQREIDYTDVSSDGRSTFMLPAGTYRVQAAEGKATAPGEVTVTAGATTPLTLTTHAGNLVVTVEQAAGVPAGDANVTIYRGQHEVDYRDVSSVGQTTFTLAAGTYEIQASEGSDVKIAHGVTITAGTTARPTLMTNAGNLQITVQQSSGAPAADAIVTIYQLQQQVDYGAVSSSGQKTFTLVAGAYDVQVKSGQTTRTGRAAVIAGRTDPVKFSLP